MISYYDILEVRANATREEIRDAYRRRVLECHPDRGGNAEDFKVVNEAYETLSNPEEREKYDQFLNYIRLQEFMARVSKSTRTEEDVTSEEQGAQQEEMNLGKGSQGPSLHWTPSHPAGVFCSYAIMMIVFCVICLVARFTTSDDGHYHIQQRKVRTAYSLPRTVPSHGLVGKNEQGVGWLNNSMAVFVPDAKAGRNPQKSDNHVNKNFMRTIELTPANYKSYLPMDLIACSYAYAGAMGEGGCIRFLDRKGTLYHLNYCRDEWSFNQLDEMFPFSSCEPGLSQAGTAAPGWNAYSMGMGNFLYIHDCLNESFQARLEQDDYFLFRDWIGIVRKLLLGIQNFREAATEELMNEQERRNKIIK